MKNKDIMDSVTKVRLKKRIKRISIVTVILLLLILLILYIVFGILYSNGNLNITMDRDLHTKNGIVIYEDPDYKVFRTELFAETLEYLDNISSNWLPEDLHETPGGSHNGKNYVVYTFFIENLGEQEADYWSEIIIDDVIKDVDEAIRLRVYRNGEAVTYAKMSQDGNPEPETVAFESNTLIVRNHVEEFKPKDYDKYTLVVWLEGNDPECTDNIVGGKFKIHMDFKSEITE